MTIGLILLEWSRFLGGVVQTFFFFKEGKISRF